MLLQLSSPLHSAGQCGNSLTTSTYDTVVIGPGYGNYTFSIPKWHPDSGTLVSVKINAEVSMSYSFTLKNSDLIPSLYSLHVGRYDKITSPAMDPYEKIVEQLIGDYPLDPGNSVVMPPFYFMDRHPNIDSITAATAPFIGYDNVQFAYSPVTYTDLRTSNNASYNYHAVAPDTVHFSVTYLHCQASTLALSLKGFMVVAADPATLRLSWTILNEQTGRSYEVEQGRDGQHFTTAGSLSSIEGNNGVADYRYAFSLPGGPATAAVQGKWYFRLKMNDGHGGSSWSEVKEYTVAATGPGGPGGLTLWPNPATDFVDIHFSGAASGNWQVDLFDAAGSRVQSDLFLHVQATRLNFRHKLAAGSYFVRATEQQGTKSFTGTLLIR